MTQAPHTEAPGYEADQVDPKIEADRQLLKDAHAKGRGATLKAFVRLSGPGWLQSAITLGGGSLAGSLYLGIIGGYELMWLQPVMMILGVIMLSAIAYVALSTGEKPFRAINKHINPVLGWGWLIAAALANMVWAMPQFSLGTAAIQQNLLPALDNTAGQYGCIAFLFIVATAVVWFYDSGGWGIKLFEIVLKIMVAIVVLSFFGVVVALSVTGGLPWGQIAAGFVPDFSLLFHPAQQLQDAVAQTANGDYWHEQIMTSQRDRMVTAAATAVGINMTFLLPYSMLRKGWDSNFRGLASFDLATGLFIPFMLATSCVMIAAATQFHADYDPGLVGESEPTALTEDLRPAYQSNLDGLLAHEGKLEEGMSDEAKAELRQQVPAEDRKMAAMLVSRDAFQLATSLQGLLGKGFSQYAFGIGVVGMAISTIIILMLINGFCLTEALGVESKGVAHRAGAILPGITGALGFLVLWGDDQARFLLAVPTSVFGMALLPIAYITFICMLNSRAILGEHRPEGRMRVVMNTLMTIAFVAATIGASWSIWSKVHWYGVGGVIAFVALAGIVHVARKNRTPEEAPAPDGRE